MLTGIKKEQFPYLNKSLQDLPDEEWRLIPDFGESYMVSNYGRVKSLARIIYYKNGPFRHRKEQMLSAGLVQSFNYYVGDDTKVLNVTLWWEGKKKTFSIRRLVYHCFVEPIDLFDYAVRILCKDGNGLNLFYENLEKATPTQQQQRIYKEERSVSCFSYLDMRNKVQKRKTRQVSQYTLLGKKVAVFSAIKLAALATGLSKSSISSALQHRSLKGGNYIWRYGNGPQIINLDGYWEKGKLTGAAKRQKKVAQYNLEGALIAIYKSLTEASKATQVTPSSISKCLNGHLYSANGFIWKPDLR